ncbi:MAG TPA: DUF1697 domain-containing protein [Gemmatimonadales bacterium]|nr:DUF1697 domain-containing protein [Gemmatimonadales bacterium]
MSTCIALLRGINVGRAKRVAMADLRALVAGLGYADVRTLLNSGNVVFRAPGGQPAAAAAKAAARIEAALAAELGLTARVTGLGADELAAIVAAEPFGALAADPSRYLVAVFRERGGAARLAGLVGRDWAPGALAVGARAAYLWCPDGILESPLLAAMGRALGDGLTTRNWTTITKLHALAGAGKDTP